MLGKCLVLLGILSLSIPVTRAQSTDNTFYASRNQVRYLLPEKSAAVFFSYPANASERSQQDYEYLCGNSSSPAILLLFQEKITWQGKTFQEVLFVPGNSPWNVYWTGPILSAQVWKNKTGVDVILELQEFPLLLEDLFRNQQIRQYLFTSLPPILTTQPGVESYEAALGALRNRLNLPSIYSKPMEQVFQMIEQTPVEEYDKVARLAKTYRNYYPELKSDPTLTAAENMSSALQFAEVKPQWVNRPYAMSPLLKIMDKVREKKSPETLTQLQTAGQQSSKVITELMSVLSPGQSESRLKALLALMCSKQTQHYSAPILITGERMLYPTHAEVNSAPLVSGDLVRVEIACKSESMLGDITRTLPVSGQYSAAQKSLLTLVLKAQDAGLKALKPGTPLTDVHQIMKQTLVKGLKENGIISSDSEADKYIMHALLSYGGQSKSDPGSWQSVQAGTVIRLQPSLYIFPQSPCPKEWWGLSVAVSDLAIVTSTEANYLEVSTPKLPSEIEAKMALSSPWEDCLK